MVLGLISVSEDNAYCNKKCTITYSKSGYSIMVPLGSGQPKNA
jgi:hypothetical protein